MRLRTRPLLTALGSLAAALAFTAASAATASAAAPGGHEGHTTYYVALGDSLSKGYMPGPGDTNQGYTDRLYAQLKQHDPGLQLVKLGCSGATTTTLMHGGDACTYSEGSQLAAAEHFLRTHRGHVKYVTLDIGANDVDSCASAAGIDQACMAKGLGTISANLPQITDALRDAGGKHVSYSVMTYYDPFLAAYLLGPTGQQEAQASVGLSHTLNGIITGAAARDHFRVADVAAAYSTDAWTPLVPLPGVGNVPLNVARICTWTFMCTKDNIHATPDGYQVIANTFAAVLPPAKRH